MTRRSHVFVAGLLLAGVAALLSFPWSAGRASSAPLPTLPSAEGPAEAARAAVDAPEARSLERRGAASEVAPAEALPATTAAAEAPGPSPVALVVLEGTAARTRDGVELGADDGGFVAHWREGARDFERAVEVRRGAWALELPPDVVLHVLELELGGAPVTLTQTAHAVPASRFLALLGAEERAVLLHVRSSTDGRALQGVEVWPGPYGFPTEVGHPGGAPHGTPLVQGAASPVRIVPHKETWASAAQYLVRAPGHAWGSIAIDHAAPGERELVLQPSAALEVELLGGAEWLGAEVRLWLPPADPDGDLRGGGYAHAARAPDAEGRADFEDLAPGEYVVTVERGWADDAASFGQARARLAPGERARLPIEVALPERPVAVRVSGTLTLPRVWGDGVSLCVRAASGEARTWFEGTTVLRVEDLEALPDADDGARRLAWSVELPVAGEYALEVDPLSVRRLLVVPAAGLAGVEVTVPAPADVEVRVVDAASGEELDVERLFWCPLAVAGIAETVMRPAARDAARGRVVFRAPAGPVHIQPTDAALTPVRETEVFQLARGSNEVELRVARRVGVRLTFLDGEARVPWSWGWGLSARRVDGPEAGAGPVAGGVGVLWFAGPGAYELLCPGGIPGYGPIDGTRFVIPSGVSSVDVTVPLARE